MRPSIASARLQVGGEIDRAKLPCRSHSGQQAGRERRGGGERERPRIACDIRSGPRREKGGPKERAAGLRDDEPGHAAERREQQTLGHELSEQSPATDAQREAHRDFAAPAERPREQQVRHVGAGDEEHDQRDAAHPDCDSRVVRLLGPALGKDRRDDSTRLHERKRGRARVGRTFGPIASLHRAGEVRVGRLHRDTGFALRERGGRIAVVICSPPGISRPDPGIVRTAEVAAHRDVRDRGPAGRYSHETGGSDADDRIHERADAQCRPEHIETAAKLRLPERVGEHHDRSPAGRRVLRAREVAADRGRGIEEREQARAHDADRHLACVRASADGKSGSPSLGEPRERRSPPCEICVPRVRHSVRKRFFAASRGAVVDAVGQRRIAQHRRRPEQQSIDDREHRRVRADAEPECEHHRNGETGLGAQAAQRIAEVLNEMLDQTDAARFAHLLFVSLDAAELPERRRACLGWRHPRGDVEGGLPLDVEAQLVVEFTLQPRASKQRDQPVPQVAQEIAQHVRTFSGRGPSRR